MDRIASKTRLVRFLLWVSLMFVESLVTMSLAPRRVFIVPAAFLVFFAPIVIMPIRRKHP
jgi:hypothetical protein